MRIIICAAALVALSFSSIGQSIWHVDASNTGTQNGNSWATAFSELQAALNSAAAGDTIFVAKGTYRPTAIAGGGTDPRDKAFVMLAQTRIFGGFAGTETSLSERSTDSISLHITNKTILSGDIGTLNDDSDNAFHVVLSLQGQNSSILDGFEITNGHANGSGTNTVSGFSVDRDAGGAIDTRTSHASFSNCILKNNKASRGGAGMNNTGGGPIVEQCGFVENIVTGTYSGDPNGGGAGMRNDDCEIHITDSYFIGNESYTNQGGGAIRNENLSHAQLTNVLIKDNYSEDGDGGGGMYNNLESVPVLRNVRFISNSTTNQGGALYNDNSQAKLFNCLFLNNHADGATGAVENDGGSDIELTNCQFIGNTTDGDGGAIQNWQSSPIIISCLFEGNEAAGDGGGIYNYNNCSPTITNCVFRGNEAGSNGGGIYNRRNCNPIITNTLLYDNEAADYGGGIYTVMSSSAPCSPVATNVTITENHAGISGGGAFDDGEGSSKLRNSIIFNNDAPANEDVDAPAASALTALRYVIIGNDLYSFGANQPTAFTTDVFVDPTNDDFHLAPNSIAKNTGDAALYLSSATPNISSVTKDLDSNARIMGLGIDLGVYEICADTFTPSASIVVSPDDSILTATAVVFTATVINAGSQPEYQWLKNGTAISGETTLTYNAISDVDFLNGDLISFWIRSNEQCLDVDTAVSNLILMQVVVLDTTDTTNNDTIIDSVDAIGKIQSQPDFRIYPNPVSSSSSVIIESKGVELNGVVLIDMSGRVIKKESVFTSTHTFQLDGVLPGIYTISLESQAGWTATKRLVVSP